MLSPMTLRSKVQEYFAGRKELPDRERLTDEEFLELLDEMIISSEKATDHGHVVIYRLTLPEPTYVAGIHVPEALAVEYHKLTPLEATYMMVTATNSMLEATGEGDDE